MKTFMLLVAACFLAQSAGALTLKEKKQLEAWTKYLADPGQSHVKSFKDKCGYDAPVSLDEKMVTPFMEANTHAGAYCDAPLSAMSGMCEDATSKTAIKAKIKSVKCINGKAGELAMKINGSVFEFTVGVGAPNLDRKVKEFLENNL